MVVSQHHHSRSAGHLFCCPGSWIRSGFRWIRA